MRYRRSALGSADAVSSDARQWTPSPSSTPYPTSIFQIEAVLIMTSTPSKLFLWLMILMYGIFSSFVSETDSEDFVNRFHLLLPDPGTALEIRVEKMAAHCVFEL